MTVSKRLRYEILRRDNHACRYCGGAAPDAVLTVDHVVPTALGGTDRPDNLVAACKDCNAGKSSASADASLVADVEQDAVRWALAMRRALELAEIERGARDLVEQSVTEILDEYPVPSYHGGGTLADHMPMDAFVSVEQFLTAGLSERDLVDAAHIAGSAYLSRRTSPKLSPQDVWRYLCGVCWRTLDKRRERAAELVRPDDAPPVESAHPCSDPWCNVHGGERKTCNICGEQDCDWLCAYFLGRYSGTYRAEHQHAVAIDNYAQLSAVCDGAILAEAGL